MEIHLPKSEETKDTSASISVSGVSAVGNTNHGHQSSVETRSDSGDETITDSPVSTARKLLSQVVQWFRKVLRIDSRRDARRASVSVLRDRKHKH